MKIELDCLKQSEIILNCFIFRYGEVVEVVIMYDQVERKKKFKKKILFY